MLALEHHHLNIGTAVFVAIIMVVAAGVALLPASVETGTTTPGSTQRMPGPYGVFRNSTDLPAWNGTQSNQGTYPDYYPSAPPQTFLMYDNMPFAGAPGSYCWPPSSWGQGSDCVDSPLGSAALPVVSVYPRPTISFESAFTKDLSGLYVELFAGKNLTRVLSVDDWGSYPNGIPLNFTTGSYVLAAYAYYGSAKISDYYNLTTVSSPSSRIDNGLKIAVGTPNVSYYSITVGRSSSSGPDLEDWPLTITSNRTTSVNLSAASVIFGTWVRFLPEQVAVGPNGTLVHMYVSGAVRPFVNNDVSNVSMMIRAAGQNGAFGQVLIPMEDGFIGVIRSTNAGNLTLNPLQPFFLFQNQTEYDPCFMVYDPPGNAGGTLQASLSVVGMTNDSRVSSVPTWLKVSVDPKVDLPAYTPAYFIVNATAAKDAPIGEYAVLLRMNINGQSSFLIIPLQVSPPVYSTPDVP